MSWGWYAGYSDAAKAFSQSWAVAAAGVLQLSFLWWSVRRAGVRMKLHWPRMTPDTKKAAVADFPGDFWRRDLSAEPVG